MNRQMSSEPACDPIQGGEWEKPFESKVVGIHTALLHNGKVLFFTYPSKHGQDNHEHSHGSADTSGDCEIFDSVQLQVEKVDLKRNIFCGGACFLDDGRLFVAGGQYQTIFSLWDPPSRDIHTFDPEEKKWIRPKEGNKPIQMRGRWYPSCVTLPDGKVLVISGRYSFMAIHFWTFRFVNNTLQIFDAKTNVLSAAEQVPFKIELYPFLHVLPSGKIFVHSETTSRLYIPSSKSWDKVPGSADFTEYETEHKYSRTNPGQGTSILLPLLPTSNPPYRARVLLVGGAGSDSPKIDTPATNTAEIIDFSEANPKWRYTLPMRHPRVMPDGIILPDGKVLIVSGSERGKSDQAVNPVLEPELFDPMSETWTTLCPMTVPRLYHATAILLPDARVLVAGTDAEWNRPPYSKDQRNVEIFKPPYLFRNSRPQIAQVQTEITYNNAFEIKSPDSKDIASVALIRSSAVTHSLNTDQRYLGLEILSTNTNKLRVRAPPTPNVAPPGWYMAFIVEDDVPSISKFVRLS